jgi:hypothetical protein
LEFLTQKLTHYPGGRSLSKRNENSKPDALARIVIPLQPQMKPHARMLHHLRFIAPLLPLDEDKITPLHYYDAAIQIARISDRELTEEEFLAGIQAAEEIMKWWVRFPRCFVPSLCADPL